MASRAAHAQRLTQEELLTRARRLEADGRVDFPHCLRRVARVRVPPPRKDALLLTDQYAPVDRLMRP